ncbi:MAG: hypothetical protein ABI333_18215 [bacterium]
MSESTKRGRPLHKRPGRAASDEKDAQKPPVKVPPLVLPKRSGSSPTMPGKMQHRKKRPTLAPPPSSSEALAPKPPPVAPAGTGQRPKKSVSPAPPPPSAVMAPKAPPSAPGLEDDAAEPGADRRKASETRPLQDISEHAHALMNGVASCLPVDSSFDFSQRIAEHIIDYWTVRRDVLRTDDDGEPELDFVSYLKVAKAIIVGSHEGEGTNLIDEAKSLADALDATQISYYAPSLPQDELRVVRSFHDLAVAMMFYKVSFHVTHQADRHVMLASSMGAHGLLHSARHWFEGFDVPEVVANYAGVLEFKINLEKDRA